MNRLAWLSLPNWVARRSVSVRTKLLVALLGIVAALVALGGAGLGALDTARDRAARLAEQQSRIDQIDLISDLAEQTMLVTADDFLAFYGKKLDGDGAIETRPFSRILNNADWVQNDIADIRRALHREPPADPDVSELLEQSLENLGALVALSRETRSAMRAGDLETAHAIYDVQATSLKKRIERAMFTLEGQISEQMQTSVLQAGSEFSTSRTVLILASALAVLMALLLGYAISASLIRPIRQIEDRMNKLGKGDFSQRLSVINRDELSDLADNVNRASDMLENLYGDVSAKTAELEQLSEKLAKYLSPQIYASIFEGRQEVTVMTTRKKLTVFFSDIADFTEMTDRLESEELTELLNQYLTEMANIALEHGATIDKYIGDSIMIFFGDPETRGVREDAKACVQMAIAMRTRMQHLEKTWRDAGIARPVKCRMGIHTDFCTVGNFGSEHRLDYTIIGRGVNIASRLENLAEPDQILLSFETYAQIREEIECEEIGDVDVKGLAYPIAAYRVTNQTTQRGASTTPGGS